MSLAGRRRVVVRWALAIVLLLLGALLLYALGGKSLLRRDATWAQMLKTKDFRVGLDPSFPPFEQLGASGAPEGLDVDLAHALARRWGIVAKITPIGYDSLLDALRTAQVDAIISAMPYDERLTRDVTYSPAYFEAGIRLVVPEGSPIRGTEELAGARVAVEWGSAGDMIARRMQRNDQVDIEIVQFDTPQDALDALLSQSSLTNTVDALLVDQVSLRLAQGEGAALVAVGPVLEANPYVIVTPRAATNLAREVADALAAFGQDGTLARIEQEWFGPTTEPPP